MKTFKETPTLKFTNLIFLKEKDLVNVEFDILGKYIKNI